MSDQLLIIFRSDIRNLDEITQKNLYFSLYNLTYPQLLFLLNDHGLAEDAVNEVFIKAMKSGPKTKPDSNIKAWLKQIARNTAFDILRKNKKYRQVSDIENVIDTKNSKSFNGITEDIDQMIDNLIRSEAIHTSLSQLKWEYRVVLYLKYIEDKSSKEIANMLGIKEPVMSKRLKKARSALAEVLTQTWGDNK